LELDFDIDAQLAAIRILLRQNVEAQTALGDEIARIESKARTLTGAQNERAVDASVDLIHHSVYQAAAHSMAAVGMLAPFVETLFFRSFNSMGLRFFPATVEVSNHARWELARALQWDCHYVFRDKRRQKNLVEGILQLADATGLAPKLPARFEPMVRLLFRYRNDNFHHGFEWPRDVRERFEKQQWPTAWIEKAMTGEEPWIFYLSDDFIKECLTIIDEVLNAIAAFIREDLLPRREVK
jgi:hypothetical protein